MNYNNRIERGCYVWQLTNYFIPRKQNEPTWRRGEWTSLCCVHPASILPSFLIAVINTEHLFKTVQAGRVYERACCLGVRQDYALKSFEPEAAGATWGRAIGQTVKQVSSRNVLIYVIMQEISILLLVKGSKMGTPSVSFLRFWFKITV